MRPYFFKLVAVVSLVLHVADPGLTLLAHNHHEEHSKPSEIASHCSSIPHSHDSGSCSHHHSHAPLASHTSEALPSDEQRSEVPDHDHSGCAACQHSVQVALRVDFTVELSSADLTAPLFIVETHTAFKFSVLRHRSRAPPAMIG